MRLDESFRLVVSRASNSFYLSSVDGGHGYLTIMFVKLMIFLLLVLFTVFFYFRFVPGTQGPISKDAPRRELSFGGIESF